MNITKRQPVSVGEMITEEFLVPMALTQGQLAEAMGVSRKTVNELCTNRRAITADTALMLATVPGLQQVTSRIKSLNRFGFERALKIPANFSIFLFESFDICRNINKRLLFVKIFLELI